MKIRIADSTNRPEPQFVVEAESDNDRHILKMFCQISHHSKVKLKFWMHGYSSDPNGYQSFNFGWIEDKTNPMPSRSKKRK